MRGTAVGRACLLLLGGLWASSPAWSAPYKITRLDGAGRLSIGALSLNNRGQVAGTWVQDDPARPASPFQGHPYFYDPTSGGKVTLPAIVPPSGGDPGGYDPRYLGAGVAGVNDAGRAVVATQQGAESFDLATGRFTPIGGRGGLLSNTGDVFATKTVDPIDGYWNSVPVAYRDGQERALGLPPGAVGAEVESINDVGDVLVRAAMSPGAFNHFFVLSGSGAWRDLGDSYAAAINDHGVVAGNLGFDAQGQPSHAALIAPDGSTTDLGALPGDSYAFAYAVNNRGEAVGLSFPENNSGLYRAFLYKDGKMVDLNDLIDPASGWSVRWGMAINDLGQILALGVLNDRERIMLLTPDAMATPPDPDFPDMPEAPVPEPSTLLVFGGLALGVGLARRRRRA